VISVWTEHYYDSQGEGRIRYCKWMPEGTPKAVVQIVHGIAEYVERYDDFAEYLNSLGFLVVAEDHMGHGKSIGKGTKGYFDGGWFAAVADTCRLMELTKAEYPDLPYVMFGHSMGSFMTRTILAKYPKNGLTAAVICGTGWISKPVLYAGKAACEAVCRKNGPRVPSETLNKMIFGAYNRKVEHVRTPYDWLSRNDHCVDKYMADPLCGFVASAGLMRDMLTGMLYNQKPANLAAMEKNLPVFFIAGGADPVGDYGKGVQRAAQEFGKAGMKDVSVRIYPLCRHEILNEINYLEVYEDVAQWITEKTGKADA